MRSLREAAPHNGCVLTTQHCKQLTTTPAHSASTSGRTPHPSSLVARRPSPCLHRISPTLLLVIDRRHVLRAARPTTPPGHRRAPGAVPVRATAGDTPPPPRRAGAELRRSITAAPGKLKAFVGELDGLWGRFVPMCLLFFAMAFNNTMYVDHICMPSSCHGEHPCTVWTASRTLLSSPPRGGARR